MLPTLQRGKLRLSISPRSQSQACWSPQPSREEMEKPMQPGGWLGEHACGGRGHLHISSSLESSGKELRPQILLEGKPAEGSGSEPACRAELQNQPNQLEGPSQDTGEMPPPLRSHPSCLLAQSCPLLAGWLFASDTPLCTGTAWGPSSWHSSPSSDPHPGVEDA